VADRRCCSHGLGGYLGLLRLGLLLALTVLVYWRGLAGGFIFDDFPNIVWKDAVHLSRLEWAAMLDAWYSGHAGPLGRPLSMLSFALNHLAAGLDPWSYKLTNLFIHTLNGLVLFFLARTLLVRLFDKSDRRSIELLSLLATALWLLHPFNLSPVLYVVQRMTLLAATFCLIGMLAYVHGRQRGGWRGVAWIASSYVVWLPLAALSKENGILLPAFLAAIEYFVFRFQGTGRARRLLLALHGLFLIMPLIALVSYSLWRPEWFLDGYINRDFSFTERLLTEARVLWRYLFLTLVPVTSQMTLFHGVTISTGLSNPWTTLPAVLGIVAMLGIALHLRPHRPLVGLAIILFLIGHSLESSIIPLELMHEHRNYLPSFGLVLAIASVLLPIDQALRKARIALSTIFILSLAAATAVRANVWADTQAQMMVEAANHPDSVGANYEAGRVLAAYAERLPTDKRGPYIEQAALYFRKAAESSGGDAALGWLPLMITASAGLYDARVDDILSRLLDVLRTRPQAAVVPDYLRSIGQCQHRNACRLSAQQVWSLYEAALANPHVGGYRRSLLLIEAARYAWYGMGNTRLALELATQAAEAYRASGCHRLDQIQMLHALGASDEAGRMLQLAKLSSIKGCAQDMMSIEHVLMRHAPS
jgi:hypothetical protein